MAERVVKNVKSLLEHTTDPCMALMTYRAIPLPWCKLSLAELLIGHKLCTDIPQTRKHLIPDWHISKGSERWTKSTRKSKIINLINEEGFKNYLHSQRMLQFGFPHKDSNVPRSYVVVNCLVSLEETIGISKSDQRTLIFH